MEQSDGGILPTITNNLPLIASLLAPLIAVPDNLNVDSYLCWRCFRRSSVRHMLGRER